VIVFKQTPTILYVKIGKQLCKVTTQFGGGVDGQALLGVGVGQNVALGVGVGVGLSQGNKFVLVGVGVCDTGNDGVIDGVGDTVGVGVGVGRFEQLQSTKPVPS
jgi:hypothetical protein